jgi:hypothetical protein
MDPGTIKACTLDFQQHECAYFFFLSSIGWDDMFACRQRSQVGSSLLWELMLPSFAYWLLNGTYASYCIYLYVERSLELAVLSNVVL